MTWLSTVLVCSAIVGGGMFALWLLHFPIRNAAIVDVGWAGGLGVLALVYAAVGPAWGPRALLIAIMGAGWGFRLAAHLLVDRIIGQPEEGRYVELRRSWKTHIGLKFLLFYQFQALLCLVLSIPFFLASRNPTPRLHPLEIAGMVLWLAALAGESIADRQLRSFKSDPDNRGRVCRSGLWNYSRHPNYFFEWLIWVGFALVALPAGHGWLALVSPGLILFFILRVTGIPPTEAQALKSRGDEYRRYQKTTSAFVPLPPRRVS